ncbi:MAG: GIY-YIG nuclease family protein [Bacteroidetes bacterium]|nr:GIY-YIG nuclease family protein [Bacteroidota bacterium]MDA1121807.1 GIY-YIG nuclease family protein [Bacteroidota bacterium]
MGNYFVYIITNPSRTVLYVGMTNDLEYRLIDHYWNKGRPKTFTGRYHCHNLVHYERYPYASMAIAREKEIKKWRREKKNELINRENPEWTFLNSNVMEWPPHPDTQFDSN